MNLSSDARRGEVLGFDKVSWIHSFCVARQREMGVSVDPGLQFDFIFGGRKLRPPILDKYRSSLLSLFPSVFG